MICSCWDKFHLWVFSSDYLTTICFLTLITLCNLKRKAGRGRGVSCGSNLLKGTTGVKPWKAYGGEIPSGFVQPPGLSRAPKPAGNGPRQPRGVVHWDYFWNILPDRDKGESWESGATILVLIFRGRSLLANNSVLFLGNQVAYIWDQGNWNWINCGSYISVVVHHSSLCVKLLGFNLVVSEACLFPTSWYVSSNQSGTQISLLPGELQMEFLIISRSGGGHRLCQLLQLASL